MVTEPGTIGPERAEGPLVVALDIGSSSVRAALHDRRGRPLRGCSAQVPYAWDLAADGSVRLSPRTLLDLVGQVLDETATIAGSLGQDVVVGGISCFFHSIVGLDEAGRPITPVLSWADTTSAAEASALRGRVDPERVREVTGAPVHATYWPARILRLRLENPAIRHWSGVAELVAEMLTGRAAVSRSMASGTGLLDRARGRWSEPLLEQLALDPAHLPPLAADDEPIGRLAGAAARRWPQFARAKWFAAWGDGACGNVGLGAGLPGTAALMVGTSGALRAVVADPGAWVSAGLFAFRLGGGALVGGQLSEGGGTLAWAGRLVRRPQAWLARRAAGIEADGHGLTTLPYVFGERSLGFHDAAHGSIIGLRPGTDAASIYRALLESIAYGFAAVDERLAEVLGGRPEVVASGGALATSPLLGQILADALGRDIQVARAIEASRRGAALLALRGAGLIDDFDAVPALATRTVRFDANRAARYQAARARQAELYEAILG